mmetsp:Transcript_88340/g.161793  ORF Transcript_88340/g.161793 Transcript_88340/m.161793 type:complete len:101 (-) Transcript_88340:603-905(-)
MHSALNQSLGVNAACNRKTIRCALARHNQKMYDEFKYTNLQKKQQGAKTFNIDLLVYLVLWQSSHSTGELLQEWRQVLSGFQSLHSDFNCGHAFRSTFST